MITKETTWTEEAIEQLLDNIRKIINDDPTILTLQSAVELLPEYTNRHVVSRGVKKYSENEKIRAMYEGIKATLENRVNIGGLRGDLNSNMAKFNLMRYGWSEKTDSNSTNLNYNINNEKDIQDKSAEEISRDYTSLLRGSQNSE